MEKKYLYTLKDVIFGLRNIYKSYNGELSKLKEYCESNANVEDFYFYVHQYAKQNPKLCCDFIEKMNTFKELVGKTKSFIVGNDINENTAIYKNGELEGMRENFPIVISPHLKEEFANQANRIIGSDLISSIKQMSENGISSLCERGKLYIRTNNIQLVPSESCALPTLFYSPLNDTITFAETDASFKVSEFGIDKVMELSFFVDSFPDYHITSMNLEAIEGKNLVIEHFEPCKKVELSITEENKGIILSKKRK